MEVATAEILGKISAAAHHTRLGEKMDTVCNNQIEGEPCLFSLYRQLSAVIQDVFVTLCEFREGA